MLGSDSVVNAVYRGKIYWFWGDTNRPAYPLGNFNVPGATSLLPSEGGLDPGVGVDLDYFVGPDGFARPTAPIPGQGPTWIFGLVVLNDPVAGPRGARERMFAGYSKIRPPMETYERGLVEFNPATNTFEKAATYPLDAPNYPTGQAFLHTVGGVAVRLLRDRLPHDPRPGRARGAEAPRVVRGLHLPGPGLSRPTGRGSSARPTAHPAGPGPRGPRR